MKNFCLMILIVTLSITADLSAGIFRVAGNLLGKIIGRGVSKGTGHSRNKVRIKGIKKIGQANTKLEETQSELQEEPEWFTIEGKNRAAHQELLKGGKPKHAVMTEKADYSLIKDLQQLLKHPENFPKTPLEADELLRTKYVPIIITIADHIMKLYSSQPIGVLYPATEESINEWWSLIKAIAPIEKQLEKMSMQDKRLLPNYSFIPIIDKFTAMPAINGTMAIRHWVGDKKHREQIFHEIEKARADNPTAKEAGKHARAIQTKAIKKVMAKLAKAK